MTHHIKETPMTVSSSIPHFSYQVFISPNLHYNDVIMSMIASQITSLTIIYSTVYSGTDQRKHQSSASLAFVRGIHRWLVNSPHKGSVTRKMFPFYDVIIYALGVQFSDPVEITHLRKHNKECKTRRFTKYLCNIYIYICVFTVWVNWSSPNGNALSPMRCRPLPELVLTYCQLDP